MLDPGDEDAGPTTWVAPAAPRGTMAMERHSLKTEDRTVRREPSSTVGRKAPATDDVALDPTERGSNWESSLRCAGTVTP